MPLVPTTRGNRVKYAASGENTAVEPIPITENPDNPAAPNQGYQSYPGAPQGVTPQLWGGSSQYSNPFVMAGTAPAQNAPSSSYVPAQYGGASDSGIWGPRSAERIPLLNKETAAQTSSKASAHVWMAQRDVINQDELGNPTSMANPMPLCPMVW